jgi:aminopeptidase-like protein
VGAFSRSPAGSYPESHSSADDLEFVRPDALDESLRALLGVLQVLEEDAVVVNRSPYGEPQLGRRGLYRAISGGAMTEPALLWVLNLSDGSRSLLEIAVRSGLPFAEIAAAATELEAHGLIGRIG